MSDSIVFVDYARVYDLLYKDKDYTGECDFLEALFKKYRSVPTRRLIDVAAGTGSHVLILSERGYDVTASDISPQMAEIAQVKAKQRGLKLRTQGGVSMTDLMEPEQGFDAVLCLFSAINYLAEPGQVERFLEAAKKQLVPGGILVFDFWNGITCLKDYSPVRVRDVTGDDLRVVRISETKLFAMENQAEVRFKCFVFEGQEGPREVDELHRIRYFFPREMSELLRKEGFKVLAMHPFKDMTRNAEPTDWNVTFVATPG